MVCPHEQEWEGVEPIRTFSGQNELIFRDFVEVFYGRPLIYILNDLNNQEWSV